MKNILIFGGTGQLGVSLCRRLSRDFTLTVLTRNTHQKAYRLKTSANAGYLSIVEGSIFDENKIRDLISKAEIVINLEEFLMKKIKQTPLKIFTLNFHILYLRYVQNIK